MMKAFTNEEYNNLMDLLSEMHLTIYNQEMDSTKRCAVDALIEEIKMDVYKAEIYDLPMLVTEGELYTLTMLYKGINKFRAQISDIIWVAYFRHIHENL